MVILALLDSNESEDEKDIENIMNDSLISTNIIRKEEVGDQSSFLSVPEASIYIFSIQNEDELIL